MATKPVFVSFLAMSLDGFIARKDNSLDWLQMAELEGEDYGFKDFLAASDAMLMGRNTWDVVLGFGGVWPYEGKKVYVLTHRSGECPHGEVLCQDSFGDLQERLAKEGVQRIYADGGQVVAQLLKENRLSTLVISVLPILLGDGIPLFPKGCERKGRLEKCQHWPSGLAQLTYSFEVLA